MTLALAFHDVRKQFGPVPVLHGVSFAVEPGRILGLLGENGAGKSTLMKIAAGHEMPSGGTLRIDDRDVAFRDARDAERQGIVLIHQEFNLAEHLTIAQNIFLGHERTRAGLLDEPEMRSQASAVLAKVGLRHDPDTPVHRLIVAEKQLVEIARALSRQARLLVMDEPTAALSPAETERLFELMAQLRAAGVTIVYISHKLDEVERITDEVVVMRDGRVVAREATAGLTRQRMARLMVGRELSDLYPPPLPAPGADAAVLLAVEGLSVPGWVEDVGFEVRAGEILGFAGLVGAGRTEMFEGLVGLRAATARRVQVAGDAAPIRSPLEAMRRGLTYLSEDRKGRGLHLALGLAENLTLMDLERYAHPLIDRAEERAALSRAVADFGIRAGALDVPASALSGGNQQKLALAKVLQPRPRVVVLDEPTRGVDVGAKRDIYFLIHRLAAQGCAVVVVSSELLELIGVCHRVSVMRAGRLVATLDAAGLSEEELIAHATGTH